MKLLFWKKRLLPLLISSCLLTSCGYTKGTAKTPLPEQSTVETTNREAPSDEAEIQTLYYIESKELSFVSDESKEAWREPLKRLLANMKQWVRWGDSDEARLVAPDSTVPSIEYGHYFGLLDLNMDGIPELLVDVGGGSSGNAYYCVYDIMSGKCLGYMDGAGDNTWCTYLNTTTGEYELIGQFQLRCGWSGRERYIYKANLLSEANEYGDYIEQSLCFSAYYDLEMVEIAENQYDEVCTASYYAYGEACTMDRYFSAYDTFMETHIRIPETALQLFAYWNICDGETDRFIKAEKMADALLSSPQKFISPEK